MAATAARLDWAQVMAWQAARHHLDERAPAGAMLEVAARIAGVHAQVLSSAELTLWARVEGLAPEAVRHALWSDRSLVKTWAMRGTLHLGVDPGDPGRHLEHGPGRGALVQVVAGAPPGRHLGPAEPGRRYRGRGGHLRPAGAGGRR